MSVAIHDKTRVRTEGNVKLCFYNMEGDMRTRKPTEVDVKRWIRQGYGQGDGENYRPFFHVRDVPSRGRSRVLLGLKSGRKHHYLSDIEYRHHILAEFHPNVTDIFDQYALLPWEETQDIAKILGVRHPIYPGTTTPVVMTSDIVLRLKTPANYCVISVKSSSELDISKRSTERVLEKLAIEKEYWRRRGIAWTVSTEQHLPAKKVKNLDMLRQTVAAYEQDRLTPILPEFLAAFYEVWEPTINLVEILDEVSSLLSVTFYESFTLFGRAVWLHLLDIDLEQTEIHCRQPVKLNRFTRDETCCQ